MSDNLNEKSNLIRRIAAGKYLKRESPPSSVREIIYWWELRRVPFNLLVGVVGLTTCMVSLACVVILSYKIKDVELIPDPPAFAIFGVILYAIAANVCYTGGWVVEVSLYFLGKKGDTHFGPMTFVLGTAFSVLLTLCPALLLISYAILMVFKPTP